MIYLKLGAGLLIVLAIFGGGWKVGSGHWHSKYDSLVAEDWKAKAVGERIARVAVEAQLAQARAVSDNNAEVLRDLQDQTAAIAAERDRSRELARRLLAGSARSCPADHPVSEAGSVTGVAPASEAGRPDEVVELLADAAAECRGTAAQLNALIGQLKPQL